MKSKMSVGCLAAIIVMTISAAPGSAQTAGFQAGIVQGHFGPTHQNQGPETRSTFTGVAIVPMWSLPPLQTNFLVPLVPTFPTVIIPNQVLVPGQTIIPSPFVSPSPTGFVPGNPVLAPNPFISATHRLVSLGTPRADVLRQFGQPSVTVITSTGETLYFTGNVTVIIQNGVVAGQR
jgi:hypothetical protein